MCSSLSDLTCSDVPGQRDTRGDTTDCTASVPRLQNGDPTTADGRDLRNNDDAGHAGDIELSGFAYRCSIRVVESSSI
jgi:hypothetical protein